MTNRMKIKYKYRLYDEKEGNTEFYFTAETDAQTSRARSARASISVSKVK